MRVAVRKLEGVESVKVSLNDGLAEVRLVPGNRVTVDQLREIIRSKGFTPKDAGVVVSGAIIEHDGAPALTFDGTTPAFRLVDSADPRGTLSALRREAQGRRIEIRGRVPERRPSAAVELPTLEVASYTIPTPSRSG